MTHEDYMRETIKVAQESEKEGGAAIGAIIVKDGEIIAEGKSLVWQHRDPSGHGESNCIRAACKELDVVDLAGCVLYGTLEPCGMCVSCAAWANLTTMYFGAYRNDVSGNEYELEDWEAEKVAPRTKLHDGKHMQIQGGILREECAQLLQNYKNWQKI
jgi:tRNA(Arg) A34 adenosine deaminase TadA